MPYSITDYHAVHNVCMTYFMMASLYLLTSFTHFVHPTILLSSGLLYMVVITLNYVPSVPTLLRVFLHKWMFHFFQVIFLDLLR